MAKPYSQDLRERVIDAVERGEMSRRAAARRYEISESVAIKWLERVERDGSREPVGYGGHRAGTVRLTDDIGLSAIWEHETGPSSALSSSSLLSRNIGYTVWLYFRFPLSLRMVEEMLAARGIDVSHETIRHWAEKFGREYSNRIRRRAPVRGDKWHLDEIVITMRGEKHWLWRAVDQDRICSRRSGSGPKRSKRHTPPHAQASEEVQVTASRHDHRQAQILRRGAQRHGSEN